jgi:hypothetical protein
MTYADKLNLNFADKSRFSLLANGNGHLTDIPRSVELSYDWQVGGILLWRYILIRLKFNIP